MPLQLTLFLFLVITTRPSYTNPYNRCSEHTAPCCKGFKCVNLDKDSKFGYCGPDVAKK